MSLLVPTGKKDEYATILKGELHTLKIKHKAVKLEFYRMMAEHFRKWRIEKRITLLEMSKQLGIKPSQLSQFEAGFESKMSSPKKKCLK